MRHRVKGRILGRTKDARKALLRGLATNFIIYERIRTTEAKAKEVQPIVEKIITIGKKDTLFNRRKIYSYLYTDNAVKKVFEVISPKYKDRHGGYSKIVKIGTRQGDGASIVQLELV